MEVWISSALLLSQDFEQIRSDIIKFNYCCKTLQKFASYYLCEKFGSQDRALWSAEASIILVYCATSIEEGDVVMDIPLKIVNYLASDWLTRLHQFKSATKKKQVIRDCIYQLYRVGRMKPENLIKEPILVAALAHRISVHELTSLRIEGKSIVAQVLDKNNKKRVRYNFLESLYSAYKDDFQHIISRDLSEYLMIIEHNLKRCLQLMQKTKLKFPAIDFVFAYLHPSVVDQISPCQIEHVKLGDFNDYNKALYEESSRYLIQQWQRSEHHRRVKTIEQILPRVLILYGPQKTKNLNEFEGDTIFPFLELPIEIMEIIIFHLDRSTMHALMCTSSTFRGWSIPAKRLMKSHFPIKHHMLDSRPDTLSISWENIYWRDSSTLTRWTKGKYSQFLIGGELQAMDENIVIGVVSRSYYGGTENTERYFWMYWNDSTRTKHELGEKYNPFSRKSACIIDSTTTDPTFALLSNHELDLYIGSKCIATHTSKQFLEIGSVLSCNHKLYIGRHMYTLDDRFSSQQLFTGQTTLLDVNPMNDMYVSSCYEDYFIDKIYLHSAKHERIGSIDEKRYKSLKFLDEFRVAGVRQDKTIKILDIRRMNEVVGTIPNTLDNDLIIDPLNLRAITMSSGSRIVNIWDLNTCQWSGGFYLQSYEGLTGGYSNYGPARVNTGYFAYPRENATVALDFTK